MAGPLIRSLRLRIFSGSYALDWLDLLISSDGRPRLSGPDPGRARRRDNDYLQL